MASRSAALRRSLLAAALVAAAWAGQLRAEPQNVPAPIFRVFLKDGSSLASYGEFVRVGERVVFSIPLGQVAGLPHLEPASVRADEVDWPETERYATALRSQRYFATRAPADFELLADAMQKLLRELTRADDPKVKLAIAERIRNALAAWPAEHHGYRTDDIRQMLTLADDVVSDLQAAKEGQFSLALVAIAEPPPHAPLLPPPSLQESIEQALRLAGFAASPAERVVLLEAARRVLEVEAQALPAAWRDKTLRNVMRAMEVDQKTTRNYARLRDQALAKVERLTAESDARGIERLIEDVRRRDEQLGRQRPDMTAAVVATLEGRLADVRRVQDDRERSEWRQKALGQYVRAIAKPLDDASRAIADIETIRAGSLLTPARQDELGRQLTRLSARIHEVAVPPDAAAVHAAFASAVSLAQHAVSLRATSAGLDPVQAMRDASAAAAGALLLLDRVRAGAGALSARSDDRPVKP